MVNPFKPDNGSDHRTGTIILQAEKPARKPGFACITLLCAECFLNVPNQTVKIQFRVELLSVTKILKSVRLAEHYFIVRSKHLN